MRCRPGCLWRTSGAGDECSNLMWKDRERGRRSYTMKEIFVPPF